MEENPTNYYWRKTFGNSRPEVRKNIILLCEDGTVMRGYMNSTIWPGESNPTYSFHGEYYEFSKHSIVHCLVNALAWMPMPDVPKVQSRIEGERTKMLQETSKE